MPQNSTFRTSALPGVRSVCAKDCDSVVNILEAEIFHTEQNGTRAVFVLVDTGGVDFYNEAVIIRKMQSYKNQEVVRIRSKLESKIATN
jgi:hypothetical protein